MTKDEATELLKNQSRSFLEHAISWLGELAESSARQGGFGEQGVLKTGMAAIRLHAENNDSEPITAAWLEQVGMVRRGVTNERVVFHSELVYPGANYSPEPVVRVVISPVPHKEPSWFDKPSSYTICRVDIAGFARDFLPPPTRDWFRKVCEVMGVELKEKS